MPPRFMTIKNCGLTSRARIKHVLENVGPPKGLVLDAGCGSGELTVSLRLRGFEVVGLDRDIILLVALNVALRRMGERCNLVAADISKLPFREASFRSVYCMEVINMLEDDEEALMEFVRILQPNGACTLSAPYEGYPVIYDPLNKFLERIGLSHRQLGIWSPGVRRLYSPSELLMKLRHLYLNPIRVDFIGKWLIPALENSFFLLFYYKVLASKFRTKFALKREGVNLAIFSAIARLLDCVLEIDNVLNVRGTHLIVETRKFEMSSSR